MLIIDAIYIVICLYKYLLIYFIFCSHTTLYLHLLILLTIDVRVCWSFFDFTEIDALVGEEVRGLHWHEQEVAWDQEEEQEASEEQANQGIREEVLSRANKITQLISICWNAVISSSGSGGGVWTAITCLL